MEKDNTVDNKGKKHHFRKRRGAVPKYVLIILLFIYFLSTVFINIIARGNVQGPPKFWTLLGVDIPITSFSGVQTIS